MMNWKTGKLNCWLRATASVVLFMFTLNTVAWADGSGTALQSLHAAHKIISPASSFKMDLPGNDAASILLPRKLGQVKSFYQGTREGLVIHIQDAHVNVEAQRR